MHRRVHGSAHVHAQARAMHGPCPSTVHAPTVLGWINMSIPSSEQGSPLRPPQWLSRRLTQVLPLEEFQVDPRSPQVPHVSNVRTLVRCLLTQWARATWIAGRSDMPRGFGYATDQVRVYIPGGWQGPPGTALTPENPHVRPGIQQIKNTGPSQKTGPPQS